MAITYGMSVKEFWEDNPDLFWAYRFSYYTNQKYEQEVVNFQSWLQGAYFFEAISVALANSFGKGKKISYTQKPYCLTKEDEERDIQEQKDKLCYIEICTDKMDMPKLAQDLISKSLAKV